MGGRDLDGPGARQATERPCRKTEPPYRCGRRARAFGRLTVAASLAAAVGAVFSGCARTRPEASVAGVRPEARRTASDAARPLDGRMRIGLRRASGAAHLALRIGGPGRLLDGPTGRELRRLAPGERVDLVADYARGQVLARGAGWSVSRPELRLRAVRIRLGRSSYPDTLRVRLAGTGLFLVNELDIETYLAGVLPGEIPAGFGMEAQKALAVAARTYALVQRGKHGDYDLCDGTCCQMYLGERPTARRGLAAVRATRRQCLWYGDELVYAFYSAHCGGISTRVEDVPLKDKPQRPLPYLVPVRDAPAHGSGYCAASPYQHWVKRLRREELERRLNADPETAVGELLDLRFTAFDATGRVLEVLLRGREPSPPMLLGGMGAATGAGVVEKRVSGWEFRNAVGPLTLKSTRVRVDRPEPNVYRFTGHGFGHGLGLCQIGANGMARRGKSYRQILAHYYPGTRVAPLPR